MSRKTVSLLMLSVLLASLLAGCGATAAQVREATAVAEATPKPEAKSVRVGTGANDLVLATTTSTADSGLLDYILPDFQKECNCKVKVIAVGSGQAMAIGAKGDADVLLVHSRKAEDQFVADGDATERFDVMYNDFVIVGPPNDPAKIGGMTSAKDAFTSIAAAKAAFVSRGDKSGTNTKELSIWASAEISSTQQVDWYSSIGQGMGETLVFANEKGAYTLSDRATWLAMMNNLPSLAILVGGNSLAENKDRTLYNSYGVMAVNPGKFSAVNASLASQFVEWILSVPTQKLIAGYGVDKWGQPLFYPNSQQYKDSLASVQPASGIPEGAALKVTGNVEAEIGWTEEQVKAMPTMQAQSKNK